MNAALLRKTIKDVRWLLIACAGTLFAFAWIRVIIVSSMQTYQLNRLARNLPDIVKRLSPVPIEQLVSYPGLVGFTFEEPLAYLIIALWTISRGSDIVSGELGRGTLEMLLAQPVSRMRYVITHTSVTLMGIMVLSLAAYAGTHVGIQTASIKTPKPKDRLRIPILNFEFPRATEEIEEEFNYIPMTDFVQPEMFRVAARNYACLGVFLMGVTTALSSWDRYRWRTIGLVVGFYIVETVIELTGMAVEGCRQLLYFTFFSAYEPVAFVTKSSENAGYAWQLWANESHGIIPDLGPLGCDLVLLAWGTLGVAIGAWVFLRRDLPAPL